MSMRCSTEGLDSILASLERRLPPSLAARFKASLVRLLRVIDGLEGEGVKVLEVVLFGSIVDESKSVRRDSDIDVLVVVEGGNIMEPLGKIVPRMVRLKRLPDGRVDAHTQFLDVENGVAWHIITARPNELSEKLDSIEGPCISLKRV